MSDFEMSLFSFNPYSESFNISFLSLIGIILFDEKKLCEESTFYKYKNIFLYFNIIYECVLTEVCSNNRLIFV